MNDGRSRSRSSWRLVAVSCASLAALLFAIHCGSEESVFTEGPCETVFKGECGKPCEVDSQCANGLYCSVAKTCTADCAPNSTCSNGIVCSPHGRCGPGGSSGGLFGGDDGSTFDDGSFTGGDSCADIDVTLSKVIPTVLLLVDQSKSMTDEDFPPNSGVKRWTVLRNVLIHPDGGIVKTLEKDVSFGLALYSWNGNSNTQCPQLTNVGWKISNYTNIYNVYADAGTIDNTPTAESILGVMGIDDAGVLHDGGFGTAKTPGPKILILATDGNPDTCQNPSNNPAARPPVVRAARLAFNAGVPLYVISVGADIDEGHQREVANAGLGMTDAGDAAVYRPANSQQLVAALNQVISGARSCKFTLNGEVVAGTESRGSVTLNGVSLTLNTANGWKLNSSKEIELTGTACSTVLTTPDAQLKVSFPCGTITNIPSLPK